MRNFASVVIMLQGGAWFTCAVYFADFAMFNVATASAIIALVVRLIEGKLAGQKVESESLTYECYRQGDELFLKPEGGLLRPSHRQEVVALHEQGRITKFK